jgi:hypothetical protein
MLKFRRNPSLTSTFNEKKQDEATVAKKKLKNEVIDFCLFFLFHVISVTKKISRDSKKEATHI